MITDNDYGGDPDGLIELAHQLLSPSVDVRAVIGSHLRERMGPVAPSCRRRGSYRGRSDRAGRRPVRRGSDGGLADHDTPAASDGVDAIVTEAMRDDVDVPLFVTCGAGLTALASAWLIEPRIGSRLTLVWIGGSEHAGHAEPPPGEGPLEYNLAIDPIAAQVVFNHSDIAIWQVPRNVYRTVIASRAELLVRMRSCGPLGRHLFGALGAVAGTAARHGIHLGETYILGDSPLVLLTALQSSFHPDAASSSFVTMPCPRILDSGEYEPDPRGRTPPRVPDPRHPPAARRPVREAGARSDR